MISKEVQLKGQYIDLIQEYLELNINGDFEEDWTFSFISKLERLEKELEDYRKKESLEDLKKPLTSEDIAYISKKIEEREKFESQYSSFIHSDS
jgi:hypothetical protein